MNKNLKRRRGPSQRFRKYFQQNHRKFFQFKNKDAYQNPRGIQKSKQT